MSLRYMVPLAKQWVDDQDLDSMVREAETMIKIAEALRSLDPVARLQVMRAVCAQHGMAVPYMDVEQAQREYEAAQEVARMKELGMEHGQE